MSLTVDCSLIYLCEQFHANKCIVFFILNKPVTAYKNTNNLIPSLTSSMVCSHHSIDDKTSYKYLYDPNLSKLKSLDALYYGDVLITKNKAYNSMSENFLSVEFSLFYAKNISVKFAFFSAGEFNEILLKKKKLVNAKLLHSALALNKKYNLASNILLDSGAINRKIFNIINLVADGISREDIAKKMHLSVRGVDYYIELSKQIFEAKNMSEMVYSASQYGLLNGDFTLELDNES